MANNFQMFPEGTKMLTTTVEGVERFLLTDFDTCELPAELQVEEIELASTTWIGWDSANSLDLGVTANTEVIESQVFEFAVITDPTIGQMRVIETGFIGSIPHKLH